MACCSEWMGFLGISDFFKNWRVGRFEEKTKRCQGFFSSEFRRF